MIGPDKALNLTTLSSSFVMSSSVANCSPPLTAGTYAVWAVGQNGYVSLAQGSSSFTLSTTNGYPIIAGGTPALVNVPANYQISGISTSSGNLVYQKVN